MKLGMLLTFSTHKAENSRILLYRFRFIPPEECTCSLLGDAASSLAHALLMDAFGLRELRLSTVAVAEDTNVN